MCTNFLLPWLPGIINEHVDSLHTVRLSEILKRHLCAREWDTRDTTLVFLKETLNIYSGMDSMTYCTFEL